LPTLSQLEETIDQHGVNVLWLTAALFNTVMDESPGILRKLDYLLTGGEALSVPHVRKALAELPNTRLINGYGPTENTTFTCCYPIPEKLPANIPSIPIGKPIAGTYVRILNNHLEPVTDGETGELYIGGAGLALGYLNRPELTAEVFLPDRFSATEGQRLYKSGDLVRRLPDDTIEFLGRCDNQLKIKGYRVEPGEIERALADHPGVRSAAVILREDVAGHKALVAFLTVDPDTALTGQELKTYLKEHLPFYLIPDFIEIVDRLALTPNGKIDRKALQARPLASARKRAQNELSGNHALVAGIWRKLLGVTRLPAHESLLDYGADSLSIVRFISRLQESGFTLELPQFYAEPTVAGIAEAMTPKPGGDRSCDLSGEEHRSAGQPIPLSAVQQSVFFLDQLLPGNPAYRFQAALHLQGELRLDVLEQAMTTIVERHQILRTTFPESDGQPRQEIHPPWPMKIPVLDLAGADEDSSSYQEAIKKCLALPIRLERLPLFHHRIIRLNDRHHVLVIVEHHIIHDGCSFAAMIAELAELYRAGLAKTSAELPPLPWQYADYAWREKEWLAGAGLRGCENFWRENLLGAPEALSLPLDHPRPEVSSFEGALLQVPLDEELSSLLKHQARQQGVSLYAFMLAAYFVLLHHLSGKSDIVVGTGAANRTSENTQKMLGMFINTLPIRTAVSGRQSFSVFCRQVNDTASRALQHQALPLKKILQAAGLKTRHGETPLISTLFNFHDSRFPDLNLPGVAGAIEYLHNDTAKFDVNVIAIPDSTYCYRSRPDAHSSGILLLWEYSTELFRAERMEEMAASYVTILKQAARSPEREVADLKPADLGHQEPNVTVLEEVSVPASGAALERQRSAVKPRPGFLPGLADFSAFVRQMWRFKPGRKKKPAALSPGHRHRPMNLTEQIIAGLWREILGVDSIELKDNFFDLGGDSLTAVVLTSRLQQHAGLKLPVSALFSNPTLEGLAQAIISNQPEKTDLVLRKEENAPFLFFLHGDYKGGGLYTRKLVNILKPGFGVVVLHPNGLQGQPLPEPVEVMAGRYIDIIRRHQKEGPFYLSGHCNGGLVAYEIARQLRAAGETVGGLFLADPSPPNFKRGKSCTREELRGVFEGRTAEEIGDLETEMRLGYLRKAYRRICRGYLVKPYAGTAVLILAGQSPTVTEGLAAGWKGFMPSLETVIVPGDHQTMVTDHVRDFAGTLHQRIILAISDAGGQPQHVQSRQADRL